MTYRIFPRAVLAILAAASLASAAAQTAVHTAPKLHSQRCGDNEGLANCGLEANTNGDYDVARDAWARAAAQEGDHLAAIWLGELYDAGHSGFPDSAVQAYKWYDIAAALHGIEIDKLPPGSIGSNQTEINYRDYVARQLTPAQIADAQRMSREWLARRGAGR